MNSDWDEIKRLASDFQKIQLTSTVQKLSERNCVEIVSLLLEKKFIEVVFTNDGKEYITPDHLQQEILDELYVHGGRVNLVELAKILNVDLSRINNLSEKISKNDPSLHFVIGQLINEDYIERIAHEINEKLSQSGEISVSDLTITFDLPSDFLQFNVVEKHIGKIIRGRQDPTNPRVFFTQAYIQKCKSKIRGALAAITQPISLAAILQHIHVPEKIFHNSWEEVAGTLGVVTSKQSNAQYIPHIYSKMQSEWISSLFKNSGYLEYDTVTKLGISDPKQFIRKQFPNENLTFLSNCAVGSKIIDLSLVTSLNECSSTKSYIDLTTILPTNMPDESIEELFNSVLTSRNLLKDFVFLNNTVFSKQYLSNLIEPCNEIAKINAKNALDSGLYQTFLAEKQISSNKLHDQDDYKTDKRDDRRKKAASGKAGGGAQGRETKTKSVKKHQRGNEKYNRNDDFDEIEELSVSKISNKKLELISIKEIENVIKKKLEEEGLEDLSRSISKLYHPQINQVSLDTAQTLFESTPQTNRRQTHSQLQDRLNIILGDIRLYERGLKLLPNDAQTQLTKYLLKSLGNDICNELTTYIANECNLNLKNPANLNIDQRNKIAQECDAEYKSSLIELNKSLNKTLDDFMNATEAVLKACSMIIKKVDKKKDRLLILNHKEKLCEQLKSSDDSAFILHLASLILFTVSTGCILHASGKFVSQILSFLSSQLNSEQNVLLMQYHDLVLKLLSSGEDSDDRKAAVDQLRILENSVRDLALTYEKPGVSKTE